MTGFTQQARGRLAVDTRYAESFKRFRIRAYERRVEREGGEKRHTFSLPMFLQTLR